MALTVWCFGSVGDLFSITNGVRLVWSRCVENAVLASRARRYQGTDIQSFAHTIRRIGSPSYL
jgi:hypothetical protein